MKNIYNLITFLLITGLFSCTHTPIIQNEQAKSKKVSEYPSDVIQDWNEVFLQIEKHAEGYRPGPATRALAYVGLSAYEGVVSGMPEYNSFDGRWEGFNIPKIDPNSEYNWPLVINASFEYLLPKFFSQARPQDLALIKSTYEKTNNIYLPIIDEDTYNRSLERGRNVAEAVWNFAKSDPIGHEHHLNPSRNYDWQQAYQKEGDWTPLAPKFELPVGGEWGKARTFSLTDDKKLCLKPMPYSVESNSDMFNSCKEVMIQQSPDFNNHITPSELWSDEFVGYTFSYGVRFLSIGNQALKKDQSNLEKAVYMVAALGVTSNDASVACWHSKYTYNKERPLPYIQRNIDKYWELYYVNPVTHENSYVPPYPSYPSGHATMSAAAAMVLNNVFDAEFKLEDNSHLDVEGLKDIPRLLMTFDEMSAEVAWSRVALGVNLRGDCEEGHRFGKEIYKSVGQLPWRK